MRKFIEDNKITFKEGVRNTNIVVLIGYSQHLGLNKEHLKKELEKEITEDSFIEKEIDRLFEYCKNKNYKSFWSTDEAKELYKF